MANLNYSNFRVIYTDDNSEDQTVEAIREYIQEEHPNFQTKFKIIENEKRVYSLANKDHMIRHECQN